MERGDSILEYFESQPSGQDSENMYNCERF